MLVFSYHALSATWPAALAVRPEQLERQLEAMLARGYLATTVHEAVHAPPAPRVFAVSFDDAYRSVHRLAFPIMRRLGVAGTVFAPTDHIDSGRLMGWRGMEHWLGTGYEAELTPMTWDELRELSDAGWEIGSHSRSHPRLSQVADDEALDDELRGSRARIEEALGQPCHTIAYPYGDHDDRVVEAVRAAGYTTGCTVPAQLEQRDPLRWPRVGIYSVDTDLTFWIKASPRVRRLRRSAAWPPVARALLRVRGRREA